MVIDDFDYFLKKNSAKNSIFFRYFEEQLKEKEELCSFGIELVSEDKKD